MTKTPRIGVVLSSGGARGVYAHTGFLLALEELGIPVMASAGCSAGAIVGGIAASGANLRVWSEVLAHLDQRRFWTPDSWPQVLWQALIRQGRGYTGISRTKAAMSFCRSQLAVQTFEECPHPFHALAISIGTGRKVMFSSGELAPRIVASAAMPVLYRPVEIDGDWYCDGALVDMAPMDAICCRHDLDALIIHHVATRFEQEVGLARLREMPWSLLWILERLFFRQRPWYLSGEHLTFHRCPCHCGAVVIVVEPDLPELPWPMTEGGAQVQTAARTQTDALLRPYLATLLDNPRQHLPTLPTPPAGVRAGRETGCGDK